MDSYIFKILTAPQWAQFQTDGHFEGAPIDQADGYIHLSTAAQARETASKHFAGQHDLILAAVVAEGLGEKLTYEVSRGGALFPHLYGTLSLADIAWTKLLPLDKNGNHIFPQEFD